MKSQLKKIKLNFTDHQGFTLIELLVSMVIMSLVVTLAGSAFVTLLKENRKAEYETQRRTNLNRAMDYIANEIRQSSNIQPGSASGEVIRLEIPQLSIDAIRGRLDYGAPTTSIYSVADGAGVWQDDHSKTITLDGNILVDGIKAPSDAPDTTDCPTTEGTLTGSNGFYACVYEGGNKVDLYLYGKLSDDRNDPNYNKPLEVKKTVFTRSTTYDTIN
jgi:prepilin-type N-terminal cleavage/methylation domain-containing protein